MCFLLAREAKGSPAAAADVQRLRPQLPRALYHGLAAGGRTPAQRGAVLHEGPQHKVAKLR